MTIRDALARYPQTAAVFARHGLAGCGGAAGPIEPIDQFARLHHVDLPALLAELEASAREAPPAPAPARPTPAPWESYRLYLKTSLVLALTAGFGIGLLAVLGRAVGPDLGVYWLPLIQAHGQVQLLGWVGLFLVGVAYHVVPRFRGVAPPSRRVALATYALLLGAVLVRALGQPLAVATGLPGAFTLAAMLQLAASALFAATLARWLVPARGRWEGYEPYLLAAGVWLMVAGLVQFPIALSTDAMGRGLVASLLAEPYLIALFHGFVLMAALGVTRRAIPLFMGLRPTHERLALAACALLNAGVALEVGGGVLSALAGPEPWRGASLLGAVLLLAGAVAFVVALRLYERAPMPPGAGQPRAHEPYVRTAYGWLLFSLGLGAVLAVMELAAGVAPTAGAANAARHAFALGFISLLIFGVASRVVPVFGGVALWRRPLLAPLYVVFNLGVVVRVAGELLGSADALGRELVACSGVLGYGGLALFALILWRTLDTRPRPAPQPAVVRGSVPLRLAGTPPSFPRAGVPLSLAAAPPSPATPGVPLPLVAALSRRAGSAAPSPHSGRAATALPRSDNSAPSTTDGNPSQPSTPVVTPDLTVADVLARWPATLDVFLAHGFAPLANPLLRATLAPRVTVAQVAAMKGVDLAALLAALQAAAR
jgi:hypothetical protein